MLGEYRRHLPGVGDTWVFAMLGRPKHDGEPIHPSDRHLFDEWLRRAERRANLPKLKGGLWHPFRRMWAMERKNLPLRDVMEVGGWDDERTVVRSYMQPDQKTMLEVLMAPLSAAAGSH
jgi:hypothetical protein